MKSPKKELPFDAFLSHSHIDADMVKFIADKLVDDAGLKIFLDKWNLVPGKDSFIQDLAKGLDNARSCVVFIGKSLC